MIKLKRCVVISSIIIASFATKALAECSIEAGESGYDFDTHQDFIKSDTVTKDLLVLISCPAEISPAGVKINFNIAGKQCRPFEWDLISGFGYSGDFPTGLNGSISYEVLSDTGTPLGSGYVQIKTAKIEQSGCKRGAKKCRKEISKLGKRAKRDVCKGILDTLRGPIVLEP